MFSTQFDKTIGLSNKTLILITILSFLFIHMLSGQNESKDSMALQIKTLRNLGTQSTHSELYVDLLNELSKNYRFRHSDSLKLLSDEAFSISTKINYDIGKAYAKDNGAGIDNAKLIEINATLRNHPVEKVGTFLRASMTAMKPIV